MTKTLPMVALALACASHGCKHVDEAKIAHKAVCEAMVKAIATNGRLLEGVTQRIKDTDRAIEMAARWDQKQVTDAENGSGLFSGAASRVAKHAGAAVAFCQSAQELHLSIERMAALIPEPAMHAGERAPLDLTCPSQYKIDVADKPSREEAAADWQRQFVDVQAAEARYRDACKEKFGVEAASGSGVAGGAEEPQ